MRLAELLKAIRDVEAMHLDDIEDKKQSNYHINNFVNEHTIGANDLTAHDIALIIESVWNREE